MPIYTFKNRVTGDEVTEMLSFSGRDEFLENNPDFYQPPTTPLIGDPMRLGVTKTSDSFQDLLKNAKRYTKDSTIQTRT